MNEHYRKRMSFVGRSAFSDTGQRGRQGNVGDANGSEGLGLGGGLAHLKWACGVWLAVSLSRGTSPANLSVPLPAPSTGVQSSPLPVLRFLTMRSSHQYSGRCHLQNHAASLGSSSVIEASVIVRTMRLLGKYRYFLSAPHHLLLDQRACDERSYPT